MWCSVAGGKSAGDAAVNAGGGGLVVVSGLNARMVIGEGVGSVRGVLVVKRMKWQM